MGDHIINGVEGAVKWTFFSFVKPGVNDTPLRWRVFMIGRRQFWKDGDYATGGLELNLIPWFETSPASHGLRYCEGCFVFDGDGHD